MVQEKKVVIQVSDWLRVYEDGSVDRTWTGLPEFTFLFRSVSPHDEFIKGVATKDVVIDKTSGHRVRIYLLERKPEDNDETKLPIILHFHGGGFCISEADWYMYYYIYSKIARAANAIVVSVYLRQAPEHRLPAQIDDSFSALLWLRSVAQADSYEPWLNEHADLNRIFLIGDSSGGNIVHEVAARAGNADLGQFKLSGGILIQPGFVRVTRSKSELEQPETSFFNVDMVDKLFSFSLPMGSTKDHRITCPMGSLAPPLDSLKLPPMLIFIGGIDIFQDTEMEYYEAMKKACLSPKVTLAESFSGSELVGRYLRPKNEIAQIQVVVLLIPCFIRRYYEDTSARDVLKDVFAINACVSYCSQPAIASRILRGS